jgi:uncharacterized glyoxalase superfamily protein PhnB
MGKSNQKVFPALRYRDGAAAVDWLARVVGFEKRLVVPGPGGQVAHAEMALGGGMIMLGSGKHGDDNPWDRVAQGTYVVVDDVDAHHARAKAAGAEIAMELHDTDYGSREYSVRDPEGHLWSFGTYRPAE